MDYVDTHGHARGTLPFGLLDEAKRIKEKPSLIVAHTAKGCGVSFMEDKVEWHAVSMSSQQVEDALKELNCPQEEIEAILSEMKED